MLDNIIGVEEAAIILELSPGTVKNMCAAGKLKAKKIGKTWVLNKEDVKMVRVERLQELNGYESGVIIYKNGDGYVTNWSNVDGYPRLFVTGVIGLGETMEFTLIEEASNDVQEMALSLAKQDHRENGIDEEPKIDKIFESDECYVFTFKDWN